MVLSDFSLKSFCVGSIELKSFQCDRCVNSFYCGYHFTTCAYAESLHSNTLNSHNVTCQLHLNKAGTFVAPYPLFISFRGFLTETVFLL